MAKQEPVEKDGSGKGPEGRQSGSQLPRPLLPRGGVAPTPGRPHELRASDGVAPRPAYPYGGPCSAPFSGRGGRFAGEAHVSPYSEEKGLHLEKEGKHAEAAQEFWGSASMKLRKADPHKAIELLERAALNHLRARDGRAINAFIEIMKMDRERAKEVAERLAGFCKEEAKKASPEDSAYLRRTSEELTRLAEGK